MAPEASRALKSSPVLVPGFRASGVHCGIKDRDLDLALIASDVPATAAGVFTRSTVVGAPVEWCREIARRGRARGVVANSGVSNVATGGRGRRDAREMATRAAAAIGARPHEIFVASTGVIGDWLPMPRIRPGIREAARALAPDGLPRAARAILTTDTVPKTASATARIGGRPVRIAGLAKGSGMIEPNMATMLSFLLTDAAVAAPLLRRVLREVADETYNRLTVDGETSTSDTLLLLANGVAGNATLRAGSRDVARFRAAVLEVASELVRALARDGEGASRLITVRVLGARSRAEADRAARRIANSMLVKTAVFGADPNWGRVLQTVGAGRVRVRHEAARVKLGGVVVYRNGVPLGASARRRAALALRAPEVEIEVALGAGRAQAHMWTCDLTEDYVRINAEYTT